MDSVLTIRNLFFAGVSFVIFYAFRSVLDNRRFKKFARENGCEDPPLFKDKLPWGIDTIYKLITFKGDLLDDWVCKQYYELGATWKGNVLFGDQVINTSDPQNIQTILGVKFKDFEIGEKRHRPIRYLIGNGIFTSDGPTWSHARAIMRPQFMREHISNLEATERHMQNLLKAIPADPTSGWCDEIDLQPLFFRLTMDNATEFLFGTSVDSQLTAMAPATTGDAQTVQTRATLMAAGKSGENYSFGEAFTTAQDYISWSFRFQQFYWLIHLFSTKYRRACQFCHRFADYFIEENFRQHKEKKPEKSNSGETYEKYVLLEALAEETQNRKELREHLLQILLAGRDTTASLLSWTFLLLSRHPHVWARLRKEIIRDFGAGSSADKELLTFHRLKSCTYLQHVLYEALRLYPVIPANHRRATADTVLPVGGGADGTKPVAVRKGQVVAYSVYAMHRRTDIWGDDAAEFRPERWQGRKLDWSFLPFNGGPRICLGQQFALTLASYVVVRILQRFDKIEPVDSSTPIEKFLSLTISPANGVKVRLGLAGRSQ
ncbi:cytochrome P450 [Xylona heveae TC161]|uniref:Cytochrome P450 n=1 Tax=Xylona heveae (strain CBS 132557 / TC161) TaxID=1328760 RepID=A0A165HM88_XYLHT|nr:cytochrome P450 [Xylona heveae TC161]KZF23725.1 cytochrome P450 [Xylona heveae TC161]